MAETEADQRPRRERRRASRAAGPAAGSGKGTTAGVSAGSTAATSTGTSTGVAGKPARAARPAAPPPLRQPNRRMVAIVSLAAGLLLVIALAAGSALLLQQQHAAEAKQERNQRFVDTASQTVVNMFSYTQKNIDESVDRFIKGTSGPLRDMMSQNNNADNLKAIFRDTGASSEGVINGAALEKVDEIAGNAAVLVSVRVTVTDMQGTNKPSQPYRMRVIVHEDDNGHMTSYDLKYPEGGN